MTPRERRALAHVVFLDCVREKLIPGGSQALRIGQLIEEELLGIEVDRLPATDALHLFEPEAVTDLT